MLVSLIASVTPHILDPERRVGLDEDQKAKTKCISVLPTVPISHRLRDWMDIRSADRQRRSNSVDVVLLGQEHCLL